MNKDTKITPGPWYAQESCSDTCLYEVVQPFHNGAVVSGEYGIESFFDARLIAAAPDMYEALEAVIRVADRNTDEFNRAKAALAKARGEG